MKLVICSTVPMIYTHSTLYNVHLCSYMYTVGCSVTPSILITLRSQSHNKMKERVSLLVIIYIISKQKHYNYQHR